MHLELWLCACVDTGTHVIAVRDSVILNGVVTYRRMLQRTSRVPAGGGLNAAVYPPDFTSNPKRGLRQQAASFEEKEGILYHSSTDLEAGIKHLRR